MRSRAGGTRHDANLSRAEGTSKSFRRRGKRRAQTVLASLRNCARLLSPPPHGFARSLGTGKVRLLVCAVAALLLLLVAVFAPMLCPYDPYAQDLSQALMPPGPVHLAGTDRSGRDLLSRVIMGTRPSVLASLVLVAIIAATGTTIGIVAAWHGGRLDAVLMRVADVFLAFPNLVFALAVAGVLGGGVVNAVIALAVVSWPKYARLARGLVLSLRQEPYLKASRLAGCGTLRLVVRHVLPNIAGTLLVTAMMDVGTMMMELAALSFLGLGARPPMAEWGSMMSESRSLLQTAPWTVFAPGAAIFVTVAVFNLLGDAVHDWLDPSRR